LLQAVTNSYVPPYGTHYYPNACKQIQGYQSYRVVDELDKVDDSFFEATVGNLSDSPAIATIPESWSRPSNSARSSSASHRSAAGAATSCTATTRARSDIRWPKCRRCGPWWTSTDSIG